MFCTACGKYLGNTEFSKQQRKTGKAGNPEEQVAPVLKNGKFCNDCRAKKPVRLSTKGF
jgi:hypothetical protein